MTKPMIRIHNVTTNEIVDREMTDEEFAQYEEQKVKDQLAVEQEAAKAAEKQALFDRLGITADEARLLLS